ncbi:hypothetical protein EMPS_03120 [Entomortierella parvispora]|uniref:Uncharacterized protein n=1 Tax=Entomortierella parvispora TaxID=205924 RepID=A0A9P3H609_9FUNG|nr:hypothetical protein EMPS_03120 [Entomortierella parvispora]
MPLPTLQPKDALVLCTVTILFIYFGLILWTNYAIIIPFWTPLFWAAALSVPLHALKSSLVPVLHEALEQDIMDIVASTVGGIVTFVLQFFLGSYITNGIRAIFLGYCYVVYMICDGRPRKEKSSKLTRENGTAAANGFWSKGKESTPFTEHAELDQIDDEDDYELHPSYQVLVEQEPDEYARPANWPSYLNLLRAAFIYGLLQLGTPAELWSFAKSIWDGVQFGTQRQLNFLLVAVLLHIQYSCLGQIVAMVERIVYPNLTPEEQREQSVLNTVPRMIRKAVQESLNSTIATAVVFLTLAVVGSLTAILSIGVAHDVQGLMSQTHHRVVQLRDYRAHLLQDVSDGSEPVATVKPALVQQADEALSQAYEAGLDWFDPILKNAFPDIAWGAAEWASEVALVVVDLSSDKEQKDSKCQVNETNQADFRAVMAMHDMAQSVFNGSSDASGSTCNSSPFAGRGREEPELWVIPTLQSLGLPQIRTHKHGLHLQTTEKQRAINISQAKYLLSVVLGYKGLNTESMLYGFNVFNDLLFRWILFLLGLMTFTGLKVSPLQRLGWLIDQALASSPSSFGSLQLSTSASPGRVLAKSIEFSISGTFIAMFKLSVYHTIFTVAWTYLLADRVMSQVALGSASSDFVDVKYAWLTSFAGIVLTLFPIAPNWLVSLPGAIVHFYVYGQRLTEAIAMAVGHLLMTNLVDGAVWDSHVVKNARPGVSSAFWLGLWIFLGGMKWGTKGLLMGPVLFAAVPSIWSVVLELRGRPRKGESISGNASTRASLIGSHANLRRLSAGQAASSKDDQSHRKENGFRRSRDQDLESEDDMGVVEEQEEIETLRYRGSSRASSVGRGTPSGGKNGYRS